MTSAMRRWTGGLAALALGSTLALAGCADTMMGSGAAMKDGDTMTKGDPAMRKDPDKGMMDKGMMKDDKGMMEKK